MSKKKRICPECDGRGLMPYVIQTAGPLPKVGSGDIIHTITERVESRPCRYCGGTGAMNDGFKADRSQGDGMNWRQVELGEENREAVRRFFQQHLCATQTECAKALGLSAMAVNRHVRAIRAEWKAIAARGTP